MFLNVPHSLDTQPPQLAAGYPVGTGQAQAAGNQLWQTAARRIRILQLTQMLAPQSNVVFNDANHTYTCDGQLLPSVTTILKRIKPAFDKEGISAKCAAKEGVSQAEILAQWKASSDAALAKGKALHANAELAALKPETWLQSTHTMVEINAWNLWWTRARKSMTPVAVEYVMADTDLGVAGTLDMLAESSKTSQRHVFDWKTGKKFGIKNDWGRKLLPPFEDLDDCELNVYSLQTSIYRLMLENRNYDCGESWIVHILGGSVVPHRALDLRERAADWLISL